MPEPFAPDQPPDITGAEGQGDLSDEETDPGEAVPPVTSGKRHLRIVGRPAAPPVLAPLPVFVSGRPVQ